eukprot:CAMPEP_0170271626 /NCGR_PEP_ID=MMETSP0116_2-20130129/35761_1 /TAXON_ID=400756 /ORGANISM="Durinskia baltica, Strain CSIRO CS-38" /LENGTH=90 /DNA_ID=CAMNT_0010522825 /DNA_START=129 /DNA_END=398 /DNA_ORIENTATION=+
MVDARPHGALRHKIVVFAVLRGAPTVPKVPATEQKAREDCRDAGHGAALHGCVTKHLQDPLATARTLALVTMQLPRGACGRPGREGVRAV